MAEQDKQEKKQVAKAYGQYAGRFTPKPDYFLNCFKAFITGGFVCMCGLLTEQGLSGMGMDQKTAGIYSTIILIMVAQLLTGLGVFDTLGKFAGAGVIVPITGFANSMVAPALEYKKEGIVLGIGAKLFSLAGPVLVCGVVVSTAIGIIYWIIGQF